MQEKVFILNFLDLNDIIITAVHWEVLEDNQ